MLNIAVVGLGKIAQKAYLPVMRSMDHIKWYMYSRNTEVLHREAQRFGRAIPCQSMEELLQFPLDGAFIHVASEAHYEIAKQFLEKGIPVYIDKPVAYSFDETLQLYRLAKENQTFLMAGLNRRFAPKVQELKKVQHKNKIVVEKNLAHEVGDLQIRLLDVFIHPLDTALYLMDQKPQKGSFFYKRVHKQLEQIVVYLESKEQTAVVQMNLSAGVGREQMEVQSSTGTYHLQNLTDFTIYQGQDIIVERFPDWTSTLYKRGFETIIQAFIQAIQTKENPVSPQSSLLSHLICERITLSKATEGFLSFTVPKEFRE